MATTPSSEGADSIAAPRHTPAPGEVFCPSCGSITQATIELCGGCGVRISNHLRRLAAASLADAQPRNSVGARPRSASDQPHRSLPFVLSLLVVAVGGLTAIPGAFQGEVLSGIMGPWLWAPIVEEVLKPSGIYLLVIKWPGSIRSRFGTALFGALAGLTFGLIESLIYVTIYFSNPTQEDVIIRFTVPVAMHILASSIFALGITRELPRSLTGGGSIQVSNWGFFLVAIVLHSSYNVFVSTVWP